MKRILFVLTAALILSSCFKDPPPPVAAYMSHKETLCNDPWGKALTTTSDTIANWLTKQNIKHEYVTIQGQIFQGAANVTKCDTFTNRMIVASIPFTDTAKAAAVGFHRYY